MPMKNEVTLEGYVAKGSHKVRFSGGGTAITQFEMKQSRKNKTTDKWEHEYVPVTYFGDDVAADIEDTKVTVVGYLKARSWLQDGSKRKALDVVANAVYPEGEEPFA